MIQPGKKSSETQWEWKESIQNKIKKMNWIFLPCPSKELTNISMTSSHAEKVNYFYHLKQGSKSTTTWLTKSYQN